MIKTIYKAEIFDFWRNLSPLILPRKIQIKLIVNEKEQQTRPMNEIALGKGKRITELLKFRGKNDEQT